MNLLNRPYITLIFMKSEDYNIKYRIFTKLYRATFLQYWTKI